MTEEYKRELIKAFGDLVSQLNNTEFVHVDIVGFNVDGDTVEHRSLEVFTPINRG